MPKPVKRNSNASMLSVIWNALHSHRENCIPEGVKEYDEEWDEICTAMGWIHEMLGVDYDELED